MGLDLLIGGFMGMGENESQNLLKRIKDAVWIIELIYPGGFLVSSYELIKGWIKKSLTSETVIYLSIIIVLTAIITGKMLWDRSCYKSYRYPRKKAKQYNYTIKKKEITYELDEEKVYYSRSVDIKSVIGHLSSIQDKYIWTGDQKRINLEAKSGIADITPKSRLGMWEYIDITLDSPISKGDDKDGIKYSWAPIENYKSSSPFFSITTDLPTKEIKLSLHLGKKYAGQEIVCEEYRSSDSDIVLSSQKQKLDQWGVYEWTISPKRCSKPRIKRFRYYLIRWNWECGEKPVELVYSSKSKDKPE